MEPHQEIDRHRHIEHEGQKQTKPAGRGMMSVGVILILMVAGYAAYAYMDRLSGKEEAAAANIKPPRIVQLDVLNGCGVNGVSAKFTNILRTHGFDVVEMKNYKSFKVNRTLVIDRIGDLVAARQVAATLGLSEDRVIQQLSPDYFVDVSVIIGSDYRTLHSEN